MSDIFKKNIRKVSQFDGVPYGNRTTKRFEVVANSSGVWADSNDATAIAIADVLYVGVIPAGMTLHESLAIVSNAFKASSTAKIGFEYVDGVDDSNVPQDDDYFFSAGLDMASQGRTYQSNATVRPVKLPKEAYVIITWAGATNDEAGVFDLLITGEL